MKKINFSFNHSNRRLHNWLIYDLNDKWLNYSLKYVNGVLFDLGCGEMPYKDGFNQYITNYIGVDWEESIHENKADIIADLNKILPIKDCTADTIISLSVIEHLYDPQVFLIESFRILKNNGYMILQVPWQWMIHEAPFDFYRYTPFGLKHLFQKAGFTIVELIPTCGYFSTTAMKFNYFSLKWSNSQNIFFRRIIKSILVPVWFINQCIAPILDKLDKNWEDECQGFFVIGKKKNN